MKNFLFNVKSNLKNLSIKMNNLFFNILRWK
jgi:hypothetical protein